MIKFKLYHITIIILKLQICFMKFFKRVSQKTYRIYSKQAPFDNRLSVWNSNRLNSLSFSVQSCPKNLSFNELFFIYVTSNDLCKCSLKFLATKCCRWLKHFFSVQLWCRKHVNKTIYKKYDSIVKTINDDKQDWHAREY